MKVLNSFPELRMSRLTFILAIQSSTSLATLTQTTRPIFSPHGFCGLIFIATARAKQLLSHARCSKGNSKRVPEIAFFRIEKSLSTHSLYCQDRHGLTSPQHLVVGQL